MSTLAALRDRLPEAAKDIRLNLGALLEPGGALTDEQRWGVAVASAIASRHDELTAAILAAARAVVDEGVIDDARAAAALMAMNNVFYRFRHMAGGGYTSAPARLRMNRLAQPRTTRANLELFSLAVSAIHGCEVCVKSHDKVVRDGGVTEEQVLDAVRIAATIHAAAVSL